MVAESVLITVRNIFNLIPKPWVLFRNLSVVVLKDPVETKSLELQATEIIKRDGPVFPGTHHGDFNVMPLTKNRGWVVTSHSEVLFTYVPHDKIPKEKGDDIMHIGLYGRGQRHKDSQTPEVVHVEHAQED